MPSEPLPILAARLVHSHSNTTVKQPYAWAYWWPWTQELKATPTARINPAGSTARATSTPT